MSSTIDVHPITTEVTYPIGMQTPFFCHICHSLLNCTVAIESNIYIGAYYNPQLLPDYSGNLSHHHEAKLLQHDIRDIDLHLIPPWEYYDKLHACTIILCNVMLHMYQMAIPNASSNQPKIRKVSDIYSCE